VKSTYHKKENINPSASSPIQPEHEPEFKMLPNYASDIALIRMYSYYLQKYFAEYSYFYRKHAGTYMDMSKVRYKKKHIELIELFQNCDRFSLNQLITQLPAYFDFFPLIKLFHKACLAQIDQKQNEFTPVLDELFLQSIRKDTLELLYKTSQKLIVFAGFSKLKNFIAALEFFNNWSSPEAAKLHKYGLKSIEIAEQCWQFILKEADSIISNVRLSSDTHSLLSQLIRPFITLHNEQMEKQLKIIRAEASLQQGDETILCEQVYRLEEIVAQQNSMRQENNHLLQTGIKEELEQEYNYKKTLTSIAVTVSPSYGKFFNGINPEKLPSAIAKIIQLSDTRAIKIPVSPVLANISIQEEKNEQPLHEIDTPLITTYLFDLTILNQLNQNTSALLKALTDVSLYRSRKKKFRTELIDLIESFNECFIQRLTDEMRIEKANLCLQYLMKHMQHSPVLNDFENEDNHELGKHVKEFLSSYSRALETELKRIDAINREIKTSCHTLQQRIKSIKIRIERSENQNQDQLTQLAESSSFSIDPYEKALINITMVVLSAQDITACPQLIPSLMTILRQSYSALLQLDRTEQKEENRSNSHPVVDQDDFMEHKQVPLQNNLPWESLKFLHAYSKIVLDAYNNYHPEKRWFLNDSEKYIHFCSEMKRRLENYNKHFTKTNSETALADASTDLNALTKFIERAIQSACFDSLGFAFYRVCQHEEDQIKKQKTITVFNWEHLKQLNKASQSALVEIKEWDRVNHGYLNSLPILTGAINHFSNQFLPEMVDASKDPKQDVNKSWHCLRYLLHRLSTDISYMDLIDCKLLPFIIKINRLTENTIEQLAIQIREKKRDHLALNKTIDEIRQSAQHDRKQKTLLYRHIQTIVNANLNHESTSVEALKKIIITLSPDKTDLEANILTLAKSALKNLSGKTHSETEPAYIHLNHDLFEEEQKVEVSTLTSDEMICVTFFHPHFNNEVTYLLKDLDTVTKDNIRIQSLIAHLQIFQKSIKSISLKKQANDYLRLIVRDISYLTDIDSLDKIIRWHLQRFLIEYNHVISEYLQHLYKTDNELKCQILKLAAKIDRINQHQNGYSIFSDHSLLIQKIIKDERCQDKPAEDTIKKLAAMIFCLNDNEIDPTLFSSIVKVFQSINSALYVGNHPQETYSFRMR